MTDALRDRWMSVSEIAAKLGANYEGQGDCRINGLATIRDANQNNLCFVSSKKFLAELSLCQAGAVLLRESDAKHCSVTAIFVENPYLAYAQVSQWLHGAEAATGGTHISAVVDTSAQVSELAQIGPNVVIEAGAVIEDGAVIAAGCFVGLNTFIGKRTRLAANVTVCRGCHIGHDCRVLSGSVIGADGFGFAPIPSGGWQRIEQIGGVRIGDRVEIGACTTIDRGALGDTVVESDVIIDNHVQIAHNVHIGQYTAIAGCVGIAGSTHVGKRCQLGGGSSIVGHLKLDDGVVVFANTFVTSSLEVGVYASASAAQPVADWRRNQPNLRQFHLLARQMRRIIGKALGDETSGAKSQE